MSAELIKRLRKQREIKITVGKITFTARRPTDVEALDLHRSQMAYTDIARRFVCDWEGVTETDVIGGGGSDVVKFDVGLWAEWCADNPQFWTPIAEAVLSAYKTHAGLIEEAEKN